MRPTALLASTADHGTRSISASYRAILEPEATHFCTLGFRRMGPRGWTEAGCFVRRRRRGTIVCLFNAPALLGAAYRRTRGVRCVAILDWTESYPSLRLRKWTHLYDWLYVSAFRRLDAVFSPSPGFRDFYNARGALIRPCYYPLPHAIPAPRRLADGLRVLYVGADYRRKGGDILLRAWAEAPPPGATLTFVCPAPPEGQIPGVRFLRNVRAGTEEQVSLFREHDLFVLPTREEPFGFALLEAVNAGMCAVTTSAAGAAEIVSDSGGLVADTPESAVSLVLGLAADRDQVARRQTACLDFLPKYRQAVLRSVDELIEP